MWCMLKRILCLTLLLCVSSCSRYYHWAKRTFEQADKKTADLTVAQAYLRDASVYNTFDTVMLVNAIWLSDDVRAIYTQLYMRRRGLPQSLYDEMIQIQKQENQRVLSFLVLMNSDNDNFLSTYNSQALWSIMLDIDGVFYTPAEIKLTHLTPEYQKIFGDWDKRFRSVYQVNFDATDKFGNPLISSRTSKIRLILRSLNYEIPLVWDKRCV